MTYNPKVHVVPEYVPFTPAQTFASLDEARVRVNKAALDLFYQVEETPVLAVREDTLRFLRTAATILANAAEVADVSREMLAADAAKYVKGRK